MKVVDGFGEGIDHALAGFKLIWKPELRAYVILPVLVNLLVFSLLTWLGFLGFEGLMDRFLPQASWLHWLRWLLWPLFAISILLLVFFGFTTLANLIAAPFNSRLSQRVEWLLTGQMHQDPRPFMKTILPTVFSELRKLAWILPRAIFFLILFLIPGINLAAPLLWFLFGAWCLMIEYSDYPLGNRGLGFGEQQPQLKARRMTGYGFGTGVTILMAIPLVNLAAMPAAVAGATRMWVSNVADTKNQSN